MNKHHPLAAIVAVSAVLATGAPAQAYTYTLSDEFWIKNGTALSSAFPGATGTAPAQGIYQETTTGASPVITQLTTTAYSGSTFRFSTPVPGAFTQNTGATTALLLNGWGMTQSFTYSGTSTLQVNTGANGANTQTGVHNIAATGSSGTSLNFEYLTGASVNASTGVMTGTQSLFNLNSVDFTAAPSTATGFTLEGLLHGVVVDTMSVSVNGAAGWTTVSPGWTNVDEIVATNEGVAGEIQMRNINLTAFVPEPGSMALLGTGLVGLGAALRRRRKSD